MPYYGIPVGQEYLPNDVGMAFSKGILTELLRNKLGFTGYVNSDTGSPGRHSLFDFQYPCVCGPAGTRYESSSLIPSSHHLTGISYLW
jgi:hypothetical protein